MMTLFSNFTLFTTPLGAFLASATHEILDANIVNLNSGTRGENVNRSSSDTKNMSFNGKIAYCFAKALATFLAFKAANAYYPPLSAAIIYYIPASAIALSNPGHLTLFLIKLITIMAVSKYVVPLAGRVAVPIIEAAELFLGSTPSPAPRRI